VIKVLAGLGMLGTALAVSRADAELDRLLPERGAAIACVQKPGGVIRLAVGSRSKRSVIEAKSSKDGLIRRMLESMQRSGIDDERTRVLEDELRGRTSTGCVSLLGRRRGRRLSPAPSPTVFVKRRER